MNLARADEADTDVSTRQHLYGPIVSSQTTYTISAIVRTTRIPTAGNGCTLSFFFFFIFMVCTMMCANQPTGLQAFRPASHSPFRSRRSQTSLNHISLAPLTPRFPVDDLAAYEDYFSGDHGQSTSYLSSSSVPSTPPILSHSRSGSRTRHHKRSKSSSRVLSDTDLQELRTPRATAAPDQGRRKNGVQTPRSAVSPGTSVRRDSEWLMRAGLALSSSTREEKGQSWLVKRESSTSLVSEADPEEIRSPRAGRAGRRPRSGLSTPAALSRRGSRSRGGSRRASKAELSMTAADVATSTQQSHSRKASVDRDGIVIPDFVDEQIRAELASIQDRDDEDSLASFDSDSDVEDEIDETEFRRLTRERGFGLGTWIDQFVSWTLFGVEEDFSTSPPVVERSSHTVSFEDSRDTVRHEEQDGHDDDGDSSVADEGLVRSVGKPGDQGGWADASWFLRLARNAIM